MRKMITFYMFKETKIKRKLKMPNIPNDVTKHCSSWWGTINFANNLQTITHNFDLRKTHLAKVSTLLATIASTKSTEWGRRIFWLKAAMICPKESRIATPIPARVSFVNTVPSKLISYIPSEGGIHLITELRGKISSLLQDDWPTLIWFLLCQRLHATTENRAPTLEGRDSKAWSTTSRKDRNCLWTNGEKLVVESHTGLTWSHS